MNMTKKTYNKELPSCAVLKELFKKIENRDDEIDFDFFGILNKLRKVVSQEVSYINLLFPEYTPHNNEYHFKNLFRIADHVLGDKLIKSMNSTELFILACALYGHDWGMAVSENEKLLITSEDENDSSDKFCLLKNEKEDFSMLLKNEGNKNTKEIPIEFWRDYVRKTHAFRSGERIYNFLKDESGGIAEAVKKVCIGHCLDFSELKNFKEYPYDFSVLNESVNLRALAIYVRLIDLLDLTEERTPYVLWKFVSPKNNYSKMEWAKHRSLHSITSSAYNDGRIIKIDGSTEDQEVYAALEDLKVWCNEQFKGCIDLLAEMNHKNHKLDIYQIQWNVLAQGFTPISIRFEFNRDRMFEILGEEIYGEDAYVFLRELLQNSVDAIRMRKELFNKREGIGEWNHGEISVKLNTLENGDSVLTWEDNGIGMNEYIIKNYLAVAGRSYYRSEDFVREGLNIDPISRFGVGILSCSTVSDNIELETYRDPYIDPDSKKLKVVIPSFNKYFRIEELPKYDFKVGTKVKVFISAKKLKKFELNNQMLRVTEYLKNIAGFIEFPIIINENGKKTVIIHPYSDEGNFINKYGNEFSYHKLELGYRWSEILLPQDLQNARDYLEETPVYIDKDLGLQNFEGLFTFIKPKNDNIDFWGNEDYLELLTEEVEIKNDSVKIRADENIRDEYINISPSSKKNNNLTIYRDGILVPSVSKFNYFFKGVGLLKPCITINIKKHDGENIDISRTTISLKNNFKSTIINELYKKIINDRINSFNNLTEKELLVEYIRLSLIYNIDDEELLEYLPSDYWVLPFITSSGEVVFEKWNEIKDNQITGLPFQFDEFVSSTLSKIIVIDKLPDSLNWRSNKSLMLGSPDKYWETVVATKIQGYTSKLLEKNFYISNIKIIKVSSTEPGHIFQFCYSPKDFDLQINIDDLLLEILKENYQPSCQELNEVFDYLSKFVINGALEHEFYFYALPRFILFPIEIREKYGFSFRVLNYYSTKSRKLLSLYIKIILSIKNSEITTIQIGQLSDALENANLGDLYGSAKSKFANLRKLWTLSKEIGICSYDDINDVLPAEEDFIQIEEKILHQSKEMDYVIEEPYLVK
jgi:hypothetical protein